MADPPVDAPPSDPTVSSLENAISPTDSPMLSIDNINLYDDAYSSLRSHFLMDGRGRRPRLPPVPLSNRIMAQLSLLKDEGNVTWDTVLTWFLKLFPEQVLTASQLQYRVQKTCNTVKNLCQEQLAAYLSQTIDFHTVPEDLLQIGLTHAVLLGDVSAYSPPNSFVPNMSIILSLDSVRTKESLPDSFIVMWIQALLKPFSLSPTASQIKHKLNKAKKDKAKYKHKPLELKEFLKKPLFETSPAVESIVDSNYDNLKSNYKVAQDEIASLKNELQREKKALAKSNEEVDRLTLENKCLKEERNMFKSENQLLEIQIDKLQQCQHELDEIRNKCFKTKSIQVCSINVHEVEKLKDQINEKEKIVESFQSEIEEKDYVICQLKKQKRSEQQQKSNFKKQLEDTVMTATTILSQVDETCKSCQVNLKCTGNIKNTYSDDIHLTYMALQGEGDVAASKCSKVINIISKYLYKKEIPICDLPSTQTALNIMSEGYFLSKTQAVENIRKSDHFTLGTDETSRQKRHYLERHIVLSNGGTMSLGFTEVATETADTLLEKSIALLEELCEIYCVQEDSIVRDALFKEILAKMKCLMSDRAAVMKLFDKKMASYKAEVLGTDCSTYFLFCNAHFLLGLTTAAESALLEIERKLSSQDIKLGRDNYPAKYFQFQNANETAGLRIIRLAADVFGPRPDEKSGCRQEWVVYLESINVTSRFSSFRSNRFNNLFHNASAVLFHEKHIIKFLENYVSHDNLKLQSILDDIRDVNIMAMVSALAKFNFLFSSPFWKLLNSQVSYGQFPPYVALMEAFLENSTPTKEPVFLDFSSSTLDLECHECNIYLETFAVICRKGQEVLNRQLEDFIGDGIFAGQMDEDTKAILMTAPLSNLSGERLFGDLDFDIGKRRRATLHLRSALNMFKHNKTGQWLSKKKTKEAIHLLSVARKHRGKIRRRSREEERDVRRLVKERIEENEKRKKEKELRDRERHLEIVNAVVAQGGLCIDRTDVDRLMEERNRVENLKAQIRYRKVILKENNLSLTGNYSQLYQCLISCLEDESQGPPRKRVKK